MTSSLELETKALLQKVLCSKALSCHTFCTVAAGSQQYGFYLSQLTRGNVRGWTGGILLLTVLSYCSETAWVAGAAAQ